uniref:Exonuclease 1 n=1 Tax=Leptocylindrus danicus TaxID=163516 RepID=A0A7S2KZ73_9STRA|mmetsp:Transcript_29225/g.42903  ORF Transcript_29225/g.42903 Transcript_29225/m.42903 type:complete len:566 (+) Transcript_29225:79-1776(+)|eukprot:CAMPEP_0116030860 /NCGR_PEP_ID=MMETSP0321-20121206/17129_1 /TAXON_ID=163516 /ORGANISM="Leptocylindrus danicus var. danicus, Strain B650" /LENGTH=565 /DNA_ID=CAMNT_0003505793 /DNA_START=26 /DNA_END=1723 /DNA_ORIENTATION=+
MTVQDLHKDILQRSKEDNANIEDLGECTLGIDLSIYLYRILTHCICVEQYHAGPDVPVTYALSLLRKKHNLLVSRGCTPVYVFDGARHPMKAATDAKRKAARSKVEERIDELKENDEETLKKLKARCVYPREDVLALVVQWFQREGIMHFSAPFEAEWQLVSLERQGLIDGIVSEDGDNIILGARTVITRLDFVTGSCFIYRNHEIWQQESAGAGEWVDHLPELATFLGNDYTKRLYGFSPRKVSSAIMPGYISAKDKDAFLENIECTSKWPKSHDPIFQKPALGFKERFKKVASLFRYPPVFMLHAKDTYGEIDLKNNDSYDVSLVPLNPFGDCEQMCSAMQRKWGEAIGFAGRPSKLLHGDTNADYKSGFCLKIWPRTGEPLPGYAAMAKHEVMSDDDVKAFVSSFLNEYFVEGPNGVCYTLEELFDMASVYIGLTRVSVEDEKLKFLSERGGTVPVLKWANGKVIKRREAIEKLGFHNKTLYIDPWQANIAQIECELHQRFDHLTLGKQKLWRIPGMGGIKKRQVKKDGIFYKVFIDYSFDLPAIIDAGEVEVIPNRRASWF